MVIRLCSRDAYCCLDHSAGVLKEIYRPLYYLGVARPYWVRSTLIIEVSLLEALSRPVWGWWKLIPSPGQAGVQ